MSRITSISEWLLRQAAVWGALAYLAFYAGVVHGAPADSAIQHYFNHNWIENVTTALFCVGMAALVIKALGLFVQFGALDRTNLSAAPEGGQQPEDADALLAELEEQQVGPQDSYLLNRLRNAITYVKQRGTADQVEDHLRHLQDSDLGRMHHSYASVRLIASTIPILGFLGTVIGITLAIAKLSAESMDKSLEEVIGGLSIAFDTTALALALSMVLLAAKFLVERLEHRLITQVDDKAESQLLGRFRQYGTDNDPHLASVRRMVGSMLDAVESTNDQQVALLGNSLQHANQQWSNMANEMAETVSKALATGLSRGLRTHSAALNDGVKSFAGELEQTLVRHAEILNTGLEQHSEVMNEGIAKHSTVLNEGVLKVSEVVEVGTAQYVDALTQAYEEHTATLIAAEKLLADENRQHLADVEGALGESILLSAKRQEELIGSSENLLAEMQAALVDAAGSTVAQQQQLIKQGDVLLQVVEATGQVRKLEEALNSNLSALAGSHDFAQTVSGLSAALQMLSARLGQPIPRAEQIVIRDEMDESNVQVRGTGEDESPASYAA